MVDPSQVSHASDHPIEDKQPTGSPALTQAGHWLNSASQNLQIGTESEKASFLPVDYLLSPPCGE